MALRKVVGDRASLAAGLAAAAVDKLAIANIVPMPDVDLETELK